MHDDEREFGLRMLAAELPEIDDLRGMIRAQWARFYDAALEHRRSHPEDDEDEEPRNDEYYAANIANSYIDELVAKVIHEERRARPAAMDGTRHKRRS